MAECNDAERLARTWIECWNRGEPEALPLHEDFVHVSPFGRFDGREHYLKIVKPLAKKNIVEMKIMRTLGGDDEAVIMYEKQTPKGPAPACDWVFVKNGEIVEVRSFYDAIELRE